MHRTFETPEPLDISVDLGSGNVHTEATETEQSIVDIEGPRAEEFTVELRGNRLVVSAPKGGLSSLFSNDKHVVRVVAPLESNLELRLGSADAQSTGTYERVQVKTGSGDIDVDTTLSHLVADSGSGDLRCDAVGGDLRVKTGSGDVEVGAIDGSATVSTGSGDIDLGLLGGSGVLKTGSGDAAVRRTSTELSFTTGSGDLRVDHALRGSVRAKTASGDLVVGVPEGTPVWADVSSATGRVRSDLAPVGKPAEGQDHVELRLQTATGDVWLRPA